MPINKTSKKAFTLIELIIVIAIISLLLSISLPALSRSREQAKGVYCLSQIRQMVIASFNYAGNNNDHYPMAYSNKYDPVQGISYRYNWDFTTIIDQHTMESKVIPGLLWQGDTCEEIQQCPSFHGEDNSLNDPYTGYNYNTSYIGHGSSEAIVTPAKLTDVRRPAVCAIFGDGEFADGANKYMRSPWTCAGDTFFNRAAGTQGYRHLDRTNVAYCDGSARSTEKLYTETESLQVDKIGPGTGFLSADNSAYDLK